MMEKRMIEDMAEMEEVMSRTADRVDIWQDRCAYTMAKAIYHILCWIVRKGWISRD